MYPEIGVVAYNFTLLQPRAKGGEMTIELSELP
jgi:hypothetical protein